MKKRDLMLEEFGISKARYRELHYFCMQYQKKREQGKKADCELIEETAKRVDEGIALYIIKNVTEGIPFEHMPVPCARSTFYRKRQEFFVQLSLVR